MLNSSSESSKTSTSTTTSRIAKTSSSQRMHHVTSSSSTSTVSSAEVKASSAAAAARKFTNMKGSIDISKARPPPLPELKMPDGASTSIDELKKKLKSSFENLVDDDDGPEPTITFPDGNTPTNELELSLSPDSLSSVTTSTGGGESSNLFLFVMHSNR